MKCNYRYCGEEIPGGLNGNRRYCDEHCSYAERLIREKEKNSSRKSLLSEIKRIEALLRVCYNRYGDRAFDVNEIRAMQMNWTVISDTISLEGIVYRKVGMYAYVAFDNNTIKIVKL